MFGGARIAIFDFMNTTTSVSGTGYWVVDSPSFGGTATLEAIADGVLVSGEPSWVGSGILVMGFSGVLSAGDPTWDGVASASIGATSAFYVSVNLDGTATLVMGADGVFSDSDCAFIGSGWGAMVCDVTLDSYASFDGTGYLTISADGVWSSQVDWLGVARLVVLVFPERGVPIRLLVGDHDALVTIPSQAVKAVLQNPVALVSITDESKEVVIRTAPVRLEVI